MSRRGSVARRERPVYADLLQAYREKPGNHSHAARFAGVSRPFARACWLNGWPELPWAAPINTVVTDDQLAARVVRSAADAKAAVETAQEVLPALEGKLADLRALNVTMEDRARKDAIEMRAMEGQGLRDAYAANNALMRMLRRLIEESAGLVDRAMDKIKSAMEEDGGTEAVKLLGDLALTVNRMNSAYHEIMKAERLHMGEPGQFIAVQGAEAFDEGEALEVLVAGARMARRYARNRGLPVQADPASSGDGGGEA